ncbi:trehalose-6-phosphate synthase [Candidatus Margulisiibacteriota bacterium]
MNSKEELLKLFEGKLKGRRLIVASNREPYIHKYDEDKVKWIRPASGLVTGLDPVLRTCKGVWVATGSGDADKEVVDVNDRIMVPPNKPSYHLRRVWLNKKQENGFYYGIANKTFWPLCHIAHVRPEFNKDDWNEYVKVNDKYARAIVDEAGNSKALIWIQDYHLALCAKFIKERNPNLVVGQFWHIPWPNPEAFRICPWKNEILEGLLANDLLGFHIKYHCDNFINTVDLNLESKIDRDTSCIIRKKHRTCIKPFPISIDFKELAEKAHSPEVDAALKEIKKKIRKPYKFLAVGIDRMDYTKGIPERLMAIDRFLEKYPSYKKKFVYLGIGVPSRSLIKEYKDLADRISSLVEDINWKHRTDDWQPIIYRKEHINLEEILAYYREASLLMVSSLHDGMNLVAKEFLAAQSRSPEGMLILSQFTGAARELPDAVLINPYDTERFADAIKYGLELPKKEKVKRMKKLIETVKEHDIYAWASSFISELQKHMKT